MNFQRLDAVDMEPLEQLVVSTGWGLVVNRLNAMLENLRDQLERDIDEISTAKIRGRCEEVRILIDLPLQMRSEIEEDLRTR